MKRRTSIEQRFWEKTRLEGDCILWTAKRDKWGYGVFRVGPKCHLAHRVAYWLAFGDYDDALEVLHTGCENRACVNPDHLALGTVNDRVSIRAQRGHDPVGERNGTKVHPERVARGTRHGSQTMPERVPRGNDHYAAKLTTEQAEAIRAAYRPNETSFGTLAADYGVSSATIWQIITGRSWKDTTLLISGLEKDCKE
jgi:predicted DNA-binding protein (UPF0251 family)